MTTPIADVSMADDEIEAAVDVLESGYLVQGDEVDQFESEFADVVGADHAIAVSSGTAALHVAYLAALEEGSEVLVPAMSHIATASMVSFAGCEPVFCDIDERRYTMDVESAKEQITDQTTAMTPVHLYGNACNIDALTDFAREHNLTLFWDSSQAHGTTYRGSDIGGFDDVVTYSFYPTKNMTTTEGGMITTNDDEIAEQCRLLRAHWQTEKYYHPQLGLNYRMTDVAGAIGRKQLEKLDDFVATRREHGQALTAGLEDIEEVTTPWVPEEVGHSYHQYTIQVDFDALSCDRPAFRETLEAEGVGTSVHYPRPLHEQPAFDTDVTLPVSERLSERVLSLPVYPTLSADDLEQVVAAVETAVETYR
jgi:perosamine synthetase